MREGEEKAKGCAISSRVKEKRNCGITSRISARREKGKEGGGSNVECRKRGKTVGNSTFLWPEQPGGEGGGGGRKGKKKREGDQHSGAKGV